MSLNDLVNHLLSNPVVEDVLRVMPGAWAAWRLSSRITRLLVSVIAKLRRWVRERREQKDAE